MVVRMAGLEPARPYGQQILSLGPSVAYNYLNYPNGMEFRDFL
jgi:hypothetical protein